MKMFHARVLLLTLVVGCSSTPDMNPNPSPSPSPSESPRSYSPRELTQLRGSGAAFEWVGYSLGSAGDVDGDGQVDVMTAALSSGDGGKVAVFKGPLRAAPSALSEALLTVKGESAFSNLGERIQGAGGCDLDGDGASELLLGAPFADVVDRVTSPASSGDNAGRAYLFYGGPQLRGERVATEADVTFTGESAYDTAGAAVACLGDLDGDGFGDLGIAAKGSDRHAPDAGAVYIFYGGRVFEPLIPLASADAIIVGDQARAQAGVSLAAVGDVTGDGRPDLAIGAPNFDAQGQESGAVYILPGIAGRWRGELSLAGETHYVSRLANARVGWSVSGAGDFDGDGHRDLVVGGSPTPLYRAEHPSPFIVLGPIAGQSGELVLEEVATELHTHETSGERVGAGVAGVGDVTGDGLDDVVIGAPNGGAVGGRVYLVAGRKDPGSGISLEEVWHAEGEAGDQLGENVAALGDIDGDGTPDFAVSAKGHRMMAAQDGWVRIFHGQRSDPDPTGGNR